MNVKHIFLSKLPATGMKERKTIYLLIVALVITTVAFVLISIWGYHYYFQPKTNTSPRKAALQPIKPSKPPADAYKNWHLSDSADAIIRARLARIDSLIWEIRGILDKQAVETQDSTHLQLQQLRQSMNELRSQNDAMQKENERLNTVLEELMATKKPLSTAGISKQAPKGLSTYASSLPLLVQHLRFEAFTVKNALTTIAADTRYLSGSFLIHVKPENPTGHLYIAIVGPSGSILTNNPAHAFETENGSKVFTVKLMFNNKKDNGSRLYFSFEKSSFVPGKYTMQIYHRGVLIGRMQRVLR